MDFFTEIKKAPAMRYLLHGSEPFLVRAAKTALEKAVSETFDLIFLREQECENAPEEANTFSFSGKPKYMLLLEPFGNRETEEKLALLAKENNEFGLAAVTMAEADKRSPLYAALQQQAYFFAPLGEPDLEKWVKRELARTAVAAQPEVVSFFLEYVDTGMDNQYNELQKLISVCQGNITRADIENICVPARAYNIYKIADFIFAGNTAAALQATGEALVGEDALYLLFTIARQFRMAFYARQLEGKGLPPAAVQKALALRPFAEEQLRRQTRRLPEEALQKGLLLLSQADEALKTGKARPELTVHALIYQLSRVCGGK